MSLLGAISTRALIGLTAATLATGGVIGGVIVKVSTTGGTPSAVGAPNSASWGQQVKDNVQRCKAQASPGQHGIGQCVSAFARQHGPHGAHGQGGDAAEPEDHGATPKPSGGPAGAPTAAPTASPSPAPPGSSGSASSHP
jgi:hypothetical protein